jgi:hypothetical protein
VAETTVKTYFYAAGFDALVNQWDTCINVVVEDVLSNKCFFFSGWNITCFMFYIHL